MKIRFLRIAQIELDDSVEYYNGERPGLGYEFLWEVFAAVDRIKAFPDAWQAFLAETPQVPGEAFPRWCGLQAD